MKTNFLITVIVLAFVFLSGCDKNTVYKKYYKDFPEYKWTSQVAEFSFDIEDTEATYDLIVTFRHIFGFQNRSVLINSQSFTPSGKEMNTVYTLEIYDIKGNPLSSCAGDYCDLETVVEENIKFTEKGTYKVNLSKMISSDISFVMEIGLVVKKHVE